MGLLSKLFGKCEETPSEMAQRLNSEFQERIAKEEQSPVSENGEPNSIWYILEANRLRELGRDEQADAILGEGFELCMQHGQEQAAQQLKRKIRGSDAG
ncbi:hypothetical protein [Phaeobacter inhibens]|uniref:hypothetical protein n=1 Tax=Phaeobacter inhibens TaxID=221822 RepID=UPI000C999430|nr:hypothetical protein [Phaeobacter inhibens]AUQ62348.1 hypothetical protein PhaeoP51_01353 [Phaeobacter inhibens]AUQ91330.1 hypothetical protein PhaeoP24_02740 [Phaeobacter inhibens]